MVKTPKKVLCTILISLIVITLIPHSLSHALAYSDTFAEVSAGGSSTLAVKTDGSLWAWGADIILRNNSDPLLWATGSATPQKIMDGVISVSAGSGYSTVIKTDGSLWAWGSNEYGQLGDGTKTDRDTPVRVLDNVISVSAGYGCTMAIKADGSLWAWGGNERGQLGDGTTVDRTTPIKIIDGIAAVSTSGYQTMAIKTDGSLWGWGDNSFCQLGDGGGGSDGDSNPTPAKIMDGVASVSAGYLNTMAVKADGSLWAWGGLDYTFTGGESGSLSYQPIPIKIMEDVRAVSAGDGRSTMVIKTDGSLWSWGYNGRGRLGDGTTASRNKPAKIMDGVAKVSSGGAHAMAIKTDGSLWGWGSNFSGQVGDLSNQDRYSPVRISAYDISVIFDGRRLDFDVPPTIVNGRTMVPLRTIFEELGATISYEYSTKTVTATKGDTVVVLTIGDSSPTVNGEVVPIDQPCIAVNGRTLVPLRFVAEAFGVKVGWDPGTYTVTITS